MKSGNQNGCIGVVAAEVNSIEQRQIMQGIIARAQEAGRRTVVFSNLYNPYEYDESLALENAVYQLTQSPALSGIIMIAESFTNARLRAIIQNHLKNRQDIPVVIIGIFIPELAYPNVRFINSSDADDMYAVACHLLDKHGVTEIDLLTGMQGNEAAQQRVQGYRRALEEHGIPFDTRRVHYGNFWTDSGEKLAGRYISGEIPMPQAVMCANDYMAYGMLDTFLRNGVRVPADVMITGYEFIHERIYHAPLLSTYQRGRRALGEAAVEILCAAECGENRLFRPPAGVWISGDSCPCGAEPAALHSELETVRVKQMYDKWNVLGTLEQQLTLCSNLDAFISALSRHHFWVRWVQNMFLCLCENWYDTNAENPSPLLTCRSVMPWNSDQPAITCDRMDFDALYSIGGAPENAVHYYLPLFFEKHFFGYYVLEYHSPDTYDDIFRNWMKSVSIGLTFLCMKNDIRYLLQCQNLSEQRDSLTGLLNLRGLEQALSARLSAENQTPHYAIALKIGVLRRDLNPAAQEQEIHLLQKAAELLREHAPICALTARISQQQFVMIGTLYESEENCKQAADTLLSVLLHETDILRTAGMESVICGGMVLEAGSTTDECLKKIDSYLAERTAENAAQRQSPHAETLFGVRNALYDTLGVTADSVCRHHSFSAGYFRQIYKDCFGVSFHQDAINARISRAVSLLTTTVFSIATVAEQCGYEDYNYFLRQFQKVTGISPGQFRKNHKG